MKKILFVITLLLLSISNVNAEACDAYDIKRLKEIADGVEITYELLPPAEGTYSIIKDNYKISISGLTNEIVVVNETDEVFYYDNKEYLNLKSGIKKMVVRSKYCARDLKKISLNLPVYNHYYDTDECKENKDLYVCQEWVEKSIETSEFYTAITEEKEEQNKKENKDFDFKITLIMLFVSLIIISLIIFIIKRKKGKLE